jgi:hypothetical protein
MNEQHSFKSFLRQTPWVISSLLLASLGCVFDGPRYSADAPTTLQIEPTSVIITADRPMTFGHKISSYFGTNVAWRVLEPGGGTVDDRGHYQAPTKPGIFRVQVSAVSDPSKKAVAKVTVVAAPTGPITAPNLVETGASGLHASVPLQPGVTYSWSIQGGSLQSNAHSNQIMFAVGAGSEILLKCRMTNAAGESHDIYQQIPKAAPVVFRLDQTSATLTVGHSMRFGYRLAGGIRPSIIWSTPLAHSGHVDQNGNYTAPMKAGKCLVRALPDTAPDQAAQVEVTVVDIPDGVIFVPPTFEAGKTSVVAWVVARPSLKIHWNLSSGTIEDDPSAQTIHFNPGADPAVTLSCRLTNEAGDTFTAQREIAMAPN